MKKNNPTRIHYYRYMHPSYSFYICGDHPCHAWVNNTEIKDPQWWDFFYLDNKHYVSAHLNYKDIGKSFEIIRL